MSPIKNSTIIYFNFIFILLVQIFMQSQAFAFDFQNWERGAKGYERVFDDVKRNEKPLILYFNTDWCGLCKKMNKYYLESAEVKQALRTIKQVEINPDKGNKEKEISKQYGVTGYPTFYVLVPGLDADTERIMPSFEKSTESKRQFIDMIKTVIAQQYSNKAYSLLQQKQHEESTKYYKKALEYNPNDFYAQNGIGYNYHDLGLQKNNLKLLKKARENFQLALKINPNNKQCKTNLKIVTKDINNYEETMVPTLVHPVPEAYTQDIDTQIEMTSVALKEITNQRKCTSGNCFNGYGRSARNNGASYKGEFKHGFFNGKGHYVATNGGIYDGNFKNSTFNGKGTYTFTDGRKYTGNFQDDYFSGYGTLSYPDGRKYVGNFRNDKFNGRGVFYYADGTFAEGYFRNGDFVGKDKNNMYLKKPKSYLIENIYSSIITPK